MVRFWLLPQVLLALSQTDDVLSDIDDDDDAVKAAFQKEAAFILEIIKRYVFAIVG